MAKPFKSKPEKKSGAGKGKKEKGRAPMPSVVPSVAAASPVPPPPEASAPVRGAVKTKPVQLGPKLTRSARPEPTVERSSKPPLPSAVPAKKKGQIIETPAPLVAAKNKLRGPVEIILTSISAPKTLPRKTGGKAAPLPLARDDSSGALARRDSEPAEVGAKITPEYLNVTERPGIEIPSERNPERKKIVFITSECTPLAQTGGLGDMVAGLTKALQARGHDIRIIMPLYRQIDRARFGIEFRRSCCVHFGAGEEIWVGIYEGRLDQTVPVWLIDYARYFDRPGIYHEGTEYPDNAYRFGLLSKAALQLCKDTGFIPHVVHAHDWMTALAPVFLKTWENVGSPLSPTGSVLTIHNIGYQGKYDPSVLQFYGFGPEYLTPDRFEDFGAVNLLKAGIQYSDFITTVSPTYAEEIRGPIGGMGLGTYLVNRHDRVRGILNGVDTTIWNPVTDPLLPERFGSLDLAGKAACKRALQERFNLRPDPKVPIFGIVSRFASQKGFDLLQGALPQALREMLIQVVALGTGDPFTEGFFRWLSSAYPGSANAHIGFSPELSHLIEAGSDFFLMPSLYEPCGLNQMYSSLYGTLPIVRATGGLDDTVENYNEAQGTGTGFKFWDSTDRALFYTIGWAVSTWYDRPHHIQAMRQAGMARNFSWAKSALDYEAVYTAAVDCRAGTLT